MASENNEDSTRRSEKLLAAAIEAQSRKLEREGRYASSLLRMSEQDAATVTQVRAQYE